MVKLIFVAALLCSSSALAGTDVMQGFACDDPDDVKIIFDALNARSEGGIVGDFAMISSLRGQGVSCWFAFGMVVTDEDVPAGSFTTSDGKAWDIVTFHRPGGGSPIYSWAKSKRKGT